MSDQDDKEFVQCEDWESCEIKQFKELLKKKRFTTRIKSYKGWRNLRKIPNMKVNRRVVNLKENVRNLSVMFVD